MRTWGRVPRRADEGVVCDHTAGASRRSSCTRSNAWSELARLPRATRPVARGVRAGSRLGGRAWRRGDPREALRSSKSDGLARPQRDHRLMRADQLSAVGATPLLAGWVPLHVQTMTRQELTNQWSLVVSEDLSFHVLGAGGAGMSGCTCTGRPIYISRAASAAKTGESVASPRAALTGTAISACTNACSPATTP
jgi:hypothetical protein